MVSFVSSLIDASNSEKWARHYWKLINRAIDRNWTFEKGKGFEKHHVFPTCVHGLIDEMRVVLTAEEHYVAHQLLVKMYPHERKLVYAANRMSKQCVNNKTFGWLRRKHAENVSLQFKGKKLPLRTAEHCENLSKARKGICLKTEEQNKAHAEMLRGRIYSDEHRKAISKGLTGKERSQEHCDAISKARTGNKYPKLSEAKKGQTPWNKGKKNVQVPWNKGITQTKQI
jgi:hypothetical protein